MFYEFNFIAHRFKIFDQFMTGLIEVVNRLRFVLNITGVSYVT